MKPQRSVDLFAPLPPWPFGALRPHAYNLIAADAPWKYEAYSERGEAKGAGAQYECLEAEEIAARFPVQDLAEPTCLLLCWATWPLIDRQLACVRAWGFEFKSIFVWQKVFPSGKPAIGTGYRVRSMCEPVIVATRGDPRHRAFPGFFAGIRREHSRKPEAFYELVSRCCPGLRRRADLFARQSREGWDTWGNEATKFDEVAS
ncbi:MT-A70 family methyltransferase [Salinarimonas soli]|uniref:DNA methyltransferase n=1 Tax=Salinarimonas soli TaxID=1638099 RepID=A0A5B2VF07_9HYPH|nr:MT-A70 family methyltransferase [Salinarimonas soli]KAA2237701.1 DNA methyltransferase [Salinarimonas soli]